MIERDILRDDDGKKNNAIESASDVDSRALTSSLSFSRFGCSSPAASSTGYAAEQMSRKKSTGTNVTVEDKRVGKDGKKRTRFYDSQSTTRG